MIMVTNETLMKFGLAKDTDNLQLKKIFKSDSKLKEVHIDTYPDNPILNSSEPFMLLLRTIEYNVDVISDCERLILRKNDKYGTHFMNILFSKIEECYYKNYSEFHEFIVNIQNIYYRITVLN